MPPEMHAPAMARNGKTRTKGSEFAENREGRIWGRPPKCMRPPWRETARPEQKGRNLPKTVRVATPSTRHRQCSAMHGGRRSIDRCRAVAVRSIREIQRTLRAIATQHGEPVNYAALGRNLGLSDRAARCRIQDLVAQGLVLLLPAYTNGVEKKRRKLPRIYLRRANPVVALLAPSVKETEIEALFQLEKRHHRDARLFHYSTYPGLGVELVVERARYRFGILCVQSEYFRRSRVKWLPRARREGIIQRGFVLHPGQRGFYAGRDVIAFPRKIFVNIYDEITHEGITNTELHLYLRWINQDLFLRWQRDSARLR